MNDRLTIAVDKDIIDLAESFVLNRRDAAQRGREAVAAGDLDILRRIGHELKGTAGSYGFDDLSTIGAELEEAAIAGNLAGAADAVERMADFLARVTLVAR